MKRPLGRGTALLTAVAAASALGLSACGSSEDPTADPAAAADDAEQQCADLADAAADAPDSGADTFVFAASADPYTLNPFHASDGDTLPAPPPAFEGRVAGG